MNMQDKEFDAIFRAKLNNLDTKPSANVWEGIAAGLDAGKKKRGLKAYLAVAACIVILVTAGIIFIPKDNVTQQQVAKTKISQHQPVNETEPVTQAKAQGIKAPAKVYAIAPKMATVSKKAPKVKEESKKEEIAEEQPVIVPVQEEPVLASNIPNKEELKPVTPDNDVELSPKIIPVETEPFRTKPVMAVSVNLPRKAAEEAPPLKKKINSFGGLLNALVSKIDKRKDKLIEFNDADGESNITGVNLGIIKIKKEEEQQ